ncbi:metal-dependent hydrolase [bacterium]|nr:metal-dependent hydrolase [candidate division CSSED10-310 bacterium]
MVELTYYGHSAVKITSDKVALMIDPFLDGNPNRKCCSADVEADVICVTHGHGDHVGDTVEIATRNDALVIAPFELATYLDMKGCRVHPMHIGGARTFDWGRVKLTPALHGSGFIEESGKIVYTGNPCGFLITLEGKTIYHAGDTGLSAEMEVVGRMNAIDLALLPIGDNFTMGPDDAVEAVRMLKPKKVVPIHYNTWEVIAQNPEGFARKVAGLAPVEIVAPGGIIMVS